MASQLPVEQTSKSSWMDQFPVNPGQVSKLRDQITTLNINFVLIQKEVNGFRELFETVKQENSDLKNELDRFKTKVKNLEQHCENLCYQYGKLKTRREHQENMKYKNYTSRKRRSRSRSRNDSHKERRQSRSRAKKIAAENLMVPPPPPPKDINYHPSN